MVSGNNCPEGAAGRGTSNTTNGSDLDHSNAVCVDSNKPQKIARITSCSLSPNCPVYILMFVFLTVLSVSHRCPRYIANFRQCVQPSCHCFAQRRVDLRVKDEPPSTSLAHGHLNLTNNRTGDLPNPSGANLLSNRGNPRGNETIAFKRRNCHHPRLLTLPICHLPCLEVIERHFQRCSTFDTETQMP